MIGLELAAFVTSVLALAAVLGAIVLLWRSAGDKAKAAAGVLVLFMAIVLMLVVVVLLLIEVAS